MSRRHRRHKLLPSRQATTQYSANQTHFHTPKFSPLQYADLQPRHAWPTSTLPTLHRFSTPPPGSSPPPVLIHSYQDRSAPACAVGGVRNTPSQLHTPPRTALLTTSRPASPFINTPTKIQTVDEILASSLDSVQHFARCPHGGVSPRRCGPSSNMARAAEQTWRGHGGSFVVAYLQSTNLAPGPQPNTDQGFDGHTFRVTANTGRDGSRVRMQHE